LKATGIVRRIDDLGRIVIPKEIRRTLRIRESDPLEIFTDREGEIILKKYSPIGEMTAFAKQYAESLAQVSGKIALIADRDQFIAAAGGLKNLLGKSISHRMEEKLNDREILLLSKADKNFVEIANEPLPDLTQYVSAPILAEGDVIGAVILAANNEKEKLGEVEARIVRRRFSGQTDGAVEADGMRKSPVLCTGDFVCHVMVCKFRKDCSLVQ